MDYSGPESADFVNVRSLNVAFLSILRSSADGAMLRRRLPEDLRPAIIGLTDIQLRRLADVPFLLMSLRERDTLVWQQLTAVEATGDLLQKKPAKDEFGSLLVAGLGFLWQLVRRSPYVARLVSGASPEWCERLADVTLLHLVQNAVTHRDLLLPRFAGQMDIWKKLLAGGTSAERDVRVAAQLSALQFMLTAEPTSRYRNLRAAACAAPVPVLHIAEKQGRH
jgi:hypothetical protein